MCVSMDHVIIPVALIVHKFGVYAWARANIELNVDF